MHFAYERPVRACVDLYWLPLGSGGPPIVRWSGRLFGPLAFSRQQHSSQTHRMERACSPTRCGFRYGVGQGPSARQLTWGWSPALISWYPS